MVYKDIIVPSIIYLATNFQTKSISINKVVGIQILLLHDQLYAKLVTIKIVKGSINFYTIISPSIMFHTLLDK